MPTVAAVTYGHVQGVHYYRTTATQLSRHTPMVGITAFGEAVGKLVLPLYEASDTPAETARPAAEGDLARAAENQAEEAATQRECEAFIRLHRLPMKVVRTFWALDRRQLTFFFTAPGRVDFRGLLRDLVRTFRTQIRLEQIGDRDVARLLGGIGRCGRPICCASWMPHFAPVSIHHARHQGLPPVPAQLAGCCGKLRCCLRFEIEDDGEVRTPDRDRLFCRPTALKTASFRWDDDPSATEIP